MNDTSEDKDGNFALINTLQQWGITLFAGMNGGGILHLCKHLEPFLALSQTEEVSRFLTLGEYIAGFVPLGYYLASGRIAGCIVTTGAAIKLVSCGLSEAKLNNIPAVYIMALNPLHTDGKSPLQDVSAPGINIVPQLQAELGDGCIVIDHINKMESQLRRAQEILSHSRPICILFHPDVLVNAIVLNVPKIEKKKTFCESDLEDFLNKLPLEAQGGRIVLYVCSEAARCKEIKNLTTQLSEVLHSPIIWSINGANAIASDNPYGCGYISLGGNDRALELWASLNQNDIMITLGFDAGEYAINLEKIRAGKVWHFTDFPEAYGHYKGEVRHRVEGNYQMVRGDIGCSLKEIIPRLQKCSFENKFALDLSNGCNTRPISRSVQEGCVDFVAFYETLYKLWQPNSIGFDDVCSAYRDRQYITQRPHPYIKFYSMQDGSAMGGAFGLGIGAKIADPKLHTFIFSGDGCWRLFGGGLAEAAHLDLRLFIINNSCFGLIEKLTDIVIPEVEKSRHHIALAKIDFLEAAVACGWMSFQLTPDLSNLKEIMDACYAVRGQSILIDVPMDPSQIIGLNPRALMLKRKGTMGTS